MPQQPLFVEILEEMTQLSFFLATNHRVLPREASGATRELVALRLERVCSVLFTPIHIQIRIDNFFGIAEFRYLYGVDTGNQSRSN